MNSHVSFTLDYHFMTNLMMNLYPSTSLSSLHHDVISSLNMTALLKENYFKKHKHNTVSHLKYNHNSLIPKYLASIQFSYFGIYIFIHTHIYIQAYTHTHTQVKNLQELGHLLPISLCDKADRQSAQPLSTLNNLCEGVWWWVLGERRLWRQKKILRCSENHM